jgi:arginyl-tRNA synthetase
VSATSPIGALAAAIAEEARALGGDGAPEVVLTPPANAAFGDLATNVAMMLARSARRAPRDLAVDLAGALTARADLAGRLERAEVAGPGFVNLTLAPAWFAEALRAIVAAGDAYGAGQAAPPERVLIEFVSANPTGPPHVGHARQAAYGDSLARVLEFAGHRVEREFYVNDYGRQMELFGVSVAARYGEIVGTPIPVPEGGYQGDYVAGVARALHGEVGARFRGRLDPMDPEALAFFTDRGRDLMLEAIRGELARFRVRHDAYFSERSLHEAGRVREGVGTLEQAGEAYRADGALWFRASAYGDEKDRVLERSDGTTTYLAADVAYHLEKAARGADRLIDVLGADHHGYVARLRAVLAAGGHDPDMLEVPIIQLVSLKDRKISKRAGVMVTLHDLIDDIGVDCARFFLVQRSHETALDIDLDLARETSQENPVYYVQYVHARIRGILDQAPPAPPEDPAPPPALDPAERALVLRLAGWPAAVREAETRRAPHRIAAELIALAGDFHAFYHRCRVVGEAPEVEAFRLDLCRATASVVRSGLALLGVEAPERM